MKMYNARFAKKFVKIGRLLKDTKQFNMVQLVLYTRIVKFVAKQFFVIEKLLPHTCVGYMEYRGKYLKCNAIGAKKHFQQMLLQNMLC